MPLPESAVIAIVAHMNDDHADAVLGYVHRFAALPAAESAALLALDDTGMTIEAHTGDAVDVVRIDFDHALRDADDARDTLIALARAT